MRSALRLLRSFSGEFQWVQLEQADASQALRSLSVFLKDCPQSDVARAVRCLSAKRMQLSAVEDALLARIPEMELKSLACLKVLSRSKPFTSALESRAIELLPSLQGEDCVALLRAFSGKYQRVTRLLRALEEKLEGEELSTKKQLEALLSFFLSAYKSQRLLSLWANQIAEAVPRMNWKEIANVMTVYGETDQMRLMRDVENFTLRHIPLLAVDEIGIVCSALALVLPTYKSKLVPTFEQEVILRAEAEKFSGYNIAKVFRGLSDQFRLVGAALESHIGELDEEDLGQVMYHLGAHQMGSASTWKRLTAQLLALKNKTKARTIAQGVYGAFHGGFREETFFQEMANRLTGQRLTVKEAEKLIPVYSSLVRKDVLEGCREVLLRDYATLPKMRVLTLINFLKQANFMVPDLYRLMMHLKGKQ